LVSVLEVLDDAIRIGGPDKGSGFAVVLAEIAVDRGCRSTSERKTSRRKRRGSGWRFLLAIACMHCSITVPSITLRAANSVVACFELGRRGWCQSENPAQHASPSEALLSDQTLSAW